MNIHTPSVPGHLKITQGMVEDAMCNPAMMAEKVMGFKLDVFQRVRLKLYWWVPYVIDTSGFSSGKTIVDWIWSQLRCLLIPDHVLLVYYQTFQIMKDQYFKYFYTCPGKIWRAHLGKMEMDEDTNRDLAKDPACWKAFYRNGSEVQCPAPGFFQRARTQASRRANDLLVDEYTKADAMATKGSGIDDQLLGRITAPSWNQDHPLWANHMKFTATAEDSSHPAYARVRAFQRAIRSGSPFHEIIRFDFKDWSDLEFSPGVTFKKRFRVDRTIAEMRAQFTRDKARQELHGLWTEQGRGWYDQELVDAAQELGLLWKVTPATNRAEVEMGG